MSIDLNARLDVDTPVTVSVVGQFGFSLGTSSGFESDVATRLTAAGLPPASLTIDLGLLGTSYNARVTCRSTNQVVTPWQVAFLISQVFAQASTQPVTAFSVTGVGRPGDVVTPESSTGAGWLDRLLAIFGDVAGVVKWAAIVIVVGFVIYLAVSTGAAQKIAASFA